MEQDAWLTKSAKILNEVKEWRKAHPKATFVEIEDEVHRRMMQWKRRCSRTQPKRVPAKHGERKQEEQPQDAPPARCHSKPEATMPAPSKAMGEKA